MPGTNPLNAAKIVASVLAPIEIPIPISFTSLGPGAFLDVILADVVAPFPRIRVGVGVGVGVIIESVTSVVVEEGRRLAVRMII